MAESLTKAPFFARWLTLAGMAILLFSGSLAFGQEATPPPGMPGGPMVEENLSIPTTQEAVKRGPQQSAPAVAEPSQLIAPEPASQPTGNSQAAVKGHEAPHWLWIVPFVVLLGSIALGPLINAHWWEHHYHYFAIGLGLVTAVYYLFFHGDSHPWFHAIIEYVSFIVLLASLYIVSGGIVIHVGSRATPQANTALLLVGAVAANVFGTTGASMLLIRPFIRMNKGHIKPYHVVFFIFIVSNLGGALTPIGDPPLFLGYLQGIPFLWTLQHLWPLWVVAVGALLVVFFVIDTLDHRKAERVHHEDDPGSVVKITGFVNFILIGMILVGVFRPSVFEYWSLIMAGQATRMDYPAILISREVLMVAAAVISFRTTPKIIHERNQFTWGPIREVAIIFIGIFSTMVPALAWLETNASKGDNAIPLKTPGQYYYATGVLSSVLDNAPTYLVFLTTRLSMLDQEHVDQAQAEVARMTRDKSLGFDPDGLPEDVAKAVAELVHDHPDHILSGQVKRREVELAFLLGNAALNAFIVAVSAGAVFFGAATYIGNGPNFMVKSIAESSGVKMPSFFGYILRYTLPVLVPILVLVWVIFFVIFV
jgi:Na+/H+ antiporter NhaD/arsenite permease-like protein